MHLLFPTAADAGIGRVGVHCTSVPLKSGMRSTESMHKEITIRGARLHNLKNVTVTIPKNKLVVLTGLSGSGTVPDAGGRTFDGG